MLRIEEREGLFSYRHEAMAAELVVSFGGVEADYARQAAQAFFARVDGLEEKLSLYREGSDVTRINLLTEGEQTRVSEECIECLRLAMLASELTGQRFHPFLGEQSLRVKGEVPGYLRSVMSDESVAGLGAAVEIDPSSRLLVKRASGAILDLGGIGKGYALDLGMDEMEDWEIPIAMANFGGSTLLFLGQPSSGVWNGEIGGRPLEPFSKGAFSSSGVGFQGEHIVGPRGERLQWERCYARTESAALADALTTGAMLMSEAELETLRAAQPRLTLAATSEGRAWGVEDFCSWQG